MSAIHFITKEVSDIRILNQRRSGAQGQERRLLLASIHDRLDALFGFVLDQFGGMRLIAQEWRSYEQSYLSDRSKAPWIDFSQENLSSTPAPFIPLIVTLHLIHHSKVPFNPEMPQAERLAQRYRNTMIGGTDDPEELALLEQKRIAREIEDTEAKIASLRAHLTVLKTRKTG